MPSVSAPAAATVPDANVTPFYTQHLDVDGFTIEGSPKVSPYALAEARWLVRKMYSPVQIRAFAQHGVRLVVVGTTEMVTDLPEYAAYEPKAWFNHRYRGIGPFEDIPVVLCPEESLLDLPGDTSPGYPTCVHELAHAANFAPPQRAGALRAEIKDTYTKAMAAGLWQDTYSASHEAEYFAEAAMIWLGAGAKASGASLGVTTREGLIAYDPGAAAVCREVFGDGTWQYESPWSRRPRDRAHLRGFDRDNAVPFSWPTRAQLEPLLVSWAEHPPAASLASTEATWLVFANRRPHDVAVEWLDLDGTRRPSFTMRPGEEVAKDTYVGHVWYVRDGVVDDAPDLGAIVAGQAVGYVEIHAGPLAPFDWENRAKWEVPRFRVPWAAHPPSVSPVSDDETWFIFANHRDRPVEVEWLDFAGVREPFFTLAPGEEKLQDAYIGHVWGVHEGDKDLGEIIAGPEVGWVDIE